MFKVKKKDKRIFEQILHTVLVSHCFADIENFGFSDTSKQKKKRFQPLAIFAKSSILGGTGCRVQKQPQRCSMKKGVLRNFTKFTGKHLCQSLFFNKVAVLRPANLLKKGLWQSCFPVNFAKFRRTHFLQNTSGRLLLRVLNMPLQNASFYANFKSAVFAETN